MSAARNRARVAAHRAALRAQGLRPIQLWIPDTRSPEFAERIRDECRRLAGDPDSAEAMDFIERVGVLDDPDAQG